MNIILVSNRFAKTRSITLNASHLLLTALLAFCLLLAAVLSAQYAIIRFQPDVIGSEMRGWLANVQSDDQQQQQSYFRDGLDAMAKRLGQMQAQLLRLDTLGARLAKLNGIKSQEIDFNPYPGQGGPYIPVAQQEVTMDSIRQQMEDLSTLLNDRSDKLATLETLQLKNRLDQKMFPSKLPIIGAEISSGFGWRIDPFTGKQALHEGLDFIAPQGTSILASAGGIVVYAGMNTEYGNMVEIDHGNNIVTRYGHASKLLVRVGQMVRRGQKIAEVGSTGRSTGSHLHFEVRYKGIAQNPRRFLEIAAG